MKYLAHTFFLIITIFICNNLVAITIVKSTNYVIVLDLSDRLLSNDQADRDLKVISSVYNSFVDKARQKSFINSKDRFKIKIIHQPGTSVSESEFQEFFELDLGSIGQVDRIKAMDQFHRQIGSALKALYHDANLGTKTSDYTGVDIWRFFNEQLVLELRSEMHNEVIILSDGYFDYESQKHPEMEKGNRYTNSHFYNSIRGKDWEEKMATYDYGLLKTNVNFNDYDCIIGIVGLNPKVNSLTELDMLKATWNKWLVENGFSNMFFIANHNDSNTMIQQLRKKVS